MNDLANRDELTGLANRRAFNIAFSREASRRTRSILLFDVDRFKQFNDSFGHLAGDACLKQVAAVLKATIKRDVDLVARFGGEEFVALLAGSALQHAEVLAERARLSVEALRIPHGGGVHGYVSLSAGVACWGEDNSESKESVMERADAALYQAKRLGRNRVHVARD